MITAIEVRMKMAEARRILEPARQKLMLVGTIPAAMIAAHVKFYGRDRRRIKREVNKAARNAKLKLR